MEPPVRIELFQQRRAEARKAVLAAEVRHRRSLYVCNCGQIVGNMWARRADQMGTDLPPSNGEEFDMPFADDAKVPDIWLCRNGMEGTLIEGGDLAEPKKVKVRRTPWDMLRERRSIEELEELLKERHEIIKSRRRGS
jgi:hypothetical protein